MKAKLEFNLPEERDDFTLANNGQNLWSVLWDFDQYLRNKIRYNINLKSYEIDIYEKIWEELYNIMDEKHIYLDMIE